MNLLRQARPGVLSPERTRVFISRIAVAGLSSQLKIKAAEPIGFPTGFSSERFRKVWESFTNAITDYA